MMNLEKTKPSAMIFAPAPTRRRLQLRLSERRLLLMAGDALAIIASVMIALFVWSRVAKEPFTLEFIFPQVAWFFVLTGLWFWLASANDFYELRVAASRSESIQKLIAITLQMLVVYLIVFFLSARDALPRLFILYYGVSAFGLVLIWRMVNPALLGWASTARRVLIVGTDWAAETIIDTLTREAHESYQILGVIGDAALVGHYIKGIPVIGTASDLNIYARREGITEIILTSTRELPGDIFQGVMDAYERGIAITPMPILYERITGRVPVEHVGQNWAVVLPINDISALNPYPVLKRLMDIGLATVGLAVFTLLLPFITLILYLDSRGSIFYSQERVGLNGRIYRIVKFRTMIPDAEKETGAVFAQADDPRITRFGRIMRKTRIDELPQLVNVLRGEMSMVGPRPERPEHVARLQAKIPFYRTRHIIRPGLTGWAQVRYKYGANDEDAHVKLQFDLYYIRHQSILLDLNILYRTVGKMLRMGGQ
jgi:exopolysaccharide biosynthesis polyprenyl glycosylphosphotransferase